MYPAYSPCDLQLVQRYKLPPSSTKMQTHCGPITGLNRDPAVFDYRVSSPYPASVRFGPYSVLTSRFRIVPQVRAKPRDQPWQPWSAPQRPVPTPAPAAPPVRPAPPPPPAPVECVQLSSLHKTGGSTSSLRFAWSLLPTDILHCTAFRVAVVSRDGREPARHFMVDGTTLQYLVDGLRAATTYAVTVEPIVNERRCQVGGGGDTATTHRIPPSLSSKGTHRGHDHRRRTARPARSAAGGRRACYLYQHRLGRATGVAMLVLPG